MKNHRVIAVLMLSLSLLFTGCAANKDISSTSKERSATKTEKADIADKNTQNDAPTSPDPKQSLSKSDKTLPKRDIRNVPLNQLMPSSMALAELSRDFERERRMQEFRNNTLESPINARDPKYAPYIQALNRALKEQWHPEKNIVLKEVQRNSLETVIGITIDDDGAVTNLQVLKPSHVAAFTQEAINAIHAASPFAPLPPAWGRNKVSIYLTFENP